MVDSLLEVKQNMHYNCVSFNAIAPPIMLISIILNVQMFFLEKVK